MSALKKDDTMKEEIVFNSRAAVRFFGIDELVAYMLSLLPLASVIAVAHASQKYRRTVVGMFR